MSPIEIEYEKEYLLTFEEMPEYNGVFKLKTKSNWFYELEKTFNMDDDSHGLPISRCFRLLYLL